MAPGLRGIHGWPYTLANGEENTRAAQGSGGARLGREAPSPPGRSLLAKAAKEPAQHALEGGLLLLLLFPLLRLLVRVLHHRRRRHSGARRPGRRGLGVLRRLGHLLRNLLRGLHHRLHDVLHVDALLLAGGRYLLRGLGHRLLDRLLRRLRHQIPRGLNHLLHHRLRHRVRGADGSLRRELARHHFGGVGVIEGQLQDQLGVWDLEQAVGAPLPRDRLTPGDLHKLVLQVHAGGHGEVERPDVAFAPLHRRGLLKVPRPERLHIAAHLEEGLERHLLLDLKGHSRAPIAGRGSLAPHVPGCLERTGGRVAGSLRERSGPAAGAGLEA
mmetsp:Transcript_19905/g.51023  ORF Transcript_19905/g.51023 Transcript_19905/m.51023 type:complete len:328 (-) Transcript_19905:206-1189(-)